MAAGCVCYRCGAYPNNPNKVLDVLKLIRCEDCGTVACVQHRGGMLGGKCANCGSSRSSIAAMQKGGSGATQKGSFGGGGGSAGGGSSTAPSNGGNVALATSQLKMMKEERSKAETEARKRLDSIAEAKKEKELTEEERKKRQEDEAAVAAVLGSGNHVKGVFASFEKDDNASANNSKSSLSGSAGGIVGMAGAAVAVSIANGLKKSDNAEGLNNGDNDLKQNANNVFVATESSNNNAESAEGNEEPLDLDALLSAKVNAAQNTTAVVQLSETEQKENEDKKNIIIKDSIKNITVLDSFNVRTNKSLKLADIIDLKNKAEENLLKVLLETFSLKDDKVKLNFKINTFIPLDYIDNFLNLHAEDLEKENVSLITGILSQKLTVDTAGYVDQFTQLLPQKDYIKGVYVSFSDDSDYSIEEQNELNLKLIDVAGENNKTVYLGLNNSSINNWQKVFDEYDLSEIEFIYTEVITSQEEFDFIKENKIKVLIRADVDYNFYNENLKNYKNFCFGSAFERIFDCTDTQCIENTSILADIIKNMYEFDKNFIEELLNLTENA